MELKERIIQIRESKKYSKKYVADCAGIPYTTYIKYEYGERELGIGALQKLADFYGVSTDYILGRPGAAPPIDGLSEMIAQNAANDIEKTLLEMYFGLDAKKRGAFLQELVDVVNQNQKNSESENEIAITEERNHTHIARIVANDGNNREIPVTDEDESEIADLLYEIEQQQRKK